MPDDQPDQPASFEEAFDKAITDANTPADAASGVADATVEPPAEPDTNPADQAADPSDAKPEWEALGFKSAADLAKSYTELRTRFSRGEHKQEDPVEDEPLEPLASGGIWVDPESVEDLYDRARENPQRAAVWAMQNRDRISDDVFNAVQNNWAAAEPWSAMQQAVAMAINGQATGQQQQFQPVVEKYLDDIRSAAAATVSDEYPGFVDAAPQIADYIDQNTQVRDWLNQQTDPATIAAAFEQMYLVIAGPSALKQKHAEQAANAEQAAIGAARQAGVTQTRNQAPRGGQPASEDLAGSIANWITS